LNYGVTGFGAKCPGRTICSGDNSPLRVAPRQIAFKYAFPDASMMSVETPRPCTVTPSISLH